MIKIEIWTDIKEYEGKYQISTEGHVGSLNYNNTGKFKLLKPKKNKYGYNEVKLSKDNKTKNYLVATLVGRAFLGECPPDMQIMHINKSDDDSLKNLKYAYRSEILHQMYKRGKRKTGIPSNYKISYKGKQYKNFSTMAKDNGLTPKQLEKRIKRKWTLEEALQIPINRKQKILNKKLYLYQNKFMSVKELSELSGISEKTIYKRLKRGWSIEETMEIPLAKNNKGDK